MPFLKQLHHLLTASSRLDIDLSPRSRRPEEQCKRLIHSYEVAIHTNQRRAQIGGRAGRSTRSRNPDDGSWSAPMVCCLYEVLAQQINGQIAVIFLGFTTFNQYHYMTSC